MKERLAALVDERKKDEKKKLADERKIFIVYTETVRQTNSVVLLLKLSLSISGLCVFWRGINRSAKSKSV